MDFGLIDHDKRKMSPFPEDRGEQRNFLRIISKIELRQTLTAPAGLSGACNRFGASFA